MYISEIRVMSISVHPNIVEYVESYQWGGRGESGTRLWVVMEAMTHGALNVLLGPPPKPINPKPQALNPWVMAYGALKVVLVKRSWFRV